MEQAGILSFGGGVHGLYQVTGDMIRPLKERLNKRWNVKTQSFSYKIGQIIITFLLVDFAWIFFRTDSLADSFLFIRRIATHFNPWTLFDQSLYALGLNQQEIHILLAAAAVLLFVDLVRCRKEKTLDIFLEEQCIWFRWGMLFFLFFFILIFGIYGPAFNAKQFIYFQF